MTAQHLTDAQRQALMPLIDQVEAITLDDVVTLDEEHYVLSRRIWQALYPNAADQEDLLLCIGDPLASLDAKIPGENITQVSLHRDNGDGPTYWQATHHCVTGVPVIGRGHYEITARRAAGLRGLLVDSRHQPKRGTPMKDAFAQVTEFHHAYGVDAPTSPTLADAGVHALRVKLISEELIEYQDAVAAGDMVEIADALADLAYVVIGSAVAHGLVNFGAIFDEVHRSNMSKLGTDGKPIRREDGKVLKGPNFSPPALARFL